jgi:hypothetical protein
VDWGRTTRAWLGFISHTTTHQPIPLLLPPYSVRGKRKRGCGGARARTAAGLDEDEPEAER